jgi:hypothetical protein
VSPIAILPVASTSAAVYGDGGTKKSPVLVARPLGVLTVMWPEVADAGTTAPIVGAAAELTVPKCPLKNTLSLPAAGSKFVPVIVTAVADVPIVGVKPLMDGAVPGPTVNGVALTALPAGDVTPIGPVVAPAGTTATSWFGVADTTVADTPLKVTAFWAAVALNPAPARVTLVPTGPELGLNRRIDTGALPRPMDTMLPRAS